MIPSALKSRVYPQFSAPKDYGITKSKHCCSKTNDRYYSSNDFLHQITPSNTKSSPNLYITKIKVLQDKLLWQYNLGN